MVLDAVELLLPLLLGGAELHCGRSPPRRGSWKLDQERLQPRAYMINAICFLAMNVVRMLRLVKY